MAGSTLTGSSFYLGQSTYNGTAAVGSVLSVHNSEVAPLTMVSNPSTITGQPYSSWTNTSTNPLYQEGYIGDNINLDLGEAVRMDLNSDNTLDGSDPWLRVTDFDRYKIDIRLEDGTIIQGVGVIISGTDPGTGNTYQSMVLGDELVLALNASGQNVTKIFLTEYVPTGTLGGDLTQRQDIANFANEIAAFEVAPCFVRGTRILTNKGERPVENLSIGDKVLTADHGLQEIRWIGSRRVPATGAMAPIRIREGALENDRELWVSPQHRMLISGQKAEILYGQSEVLVPAKSLVDDRMIRAVEGGNVEYFHILLDRHEVIFANGTPAESLYLGPGALKGLAPSDREEVLALFPELEARLERGERPEGARPFLSVREGRELIGRV